MGKGFQHTLSAAAIESLYSDQEKNIRRAFITIRNKKELFFTVSKNIQLFFQGPEKG